MTPKFSLLRRLALGVLALCAAPAALLPPPAAAQASSSRVLLAPRNPQALATAADSGPMPSSQRVSLTLTLAPDPARSAALDQYLAALITPSSTGYHQWLTPAQFAADYGATPDQLAAVTAWASGADLTIDSISPSATRITVSGPAGRVQTAFATSLHLYQLNVAVYYAAATQPSLPAAAASLFTAVEGLDNLPSSTPFTAQPFTTLAAQVDSNTIPILALTGTSTLSADQLPGYTQLFRQAAAQGITLLLPTAAGTFADATSLVDATSTPTGNATPRPTWQSAPGLPAGDLRATPDLAAASLTALTQSLTAIAGTGRLGNIAPVLYQLAPTPHLFDQAGTWQPATGLGTVDLDTLAKAYPRGTGSSFTSFSATNYSPTHGQGTSFTSNVTSGTGGAQPTGTVSFVTSTGTVLGTVTLVGGSATLAVNTLDGGNYTLGAVYNGDGTYASSKSPTSQIYVAPEPSQLSAAVTGSPTVGGTFTVTVTDSATLGSPTGPITLTVSGTSTILTQTLTPATAASATATFTVPASAPGGITLSINCTSSTNYSCSNPLTTNVQISKATPVLSISYTPNPPVSGAQISLNAVVSTVGSAPAPTGNVRFFDNSTLLNAGALSGGTTSTTGTVPTTATHSITATYDGDPNYNSVSTVAGASTSGTISTNTQLTSSSSTVNAGANITFTAVIVPASTGPASPSGTVQFFDGGISLGTANVAGSSALLTVNTLTATASHTLTAIYSGDAYYSTSTSNSVTLSAGTSTNNTSTTLTVSNTTPVHGSSVTFSATVAPPAGGTTPAGTVTFSTSAGQLGQVSLSNGVATLATNALPGGSSGVVATYNGTTPYNASTSVALAVNVMPEPVQLSFVNAPSPTFGGVLSVQVNVTGASGVSYPTGLVTVQPSGSGYTATTSGAVASSGTTSAGSATVTLQEIAAGSVLLTATYAGDKNFAAAGPISTSVAIARAVSTTALSYTPAPPVPGQTLVLTAKVGFVSTIGATGIVQFKDGAVILGTGTLDSTGTASLSTTLSSGIQILTASYLGDTNYLPSNSPAATTGTGSSATITALSINPSTATIGTMVALSATVGPTVNGVAATGTVQFVANGNVLCTATVTGSNGACSIVASVAGTLSITASYLGDSNYAPSSSAAANLIVSNPAGGLTASVSPANLTGNTSATVTAVVTAPVGVVPTGSVSATILSSTGAVQSTYSVPLSGTGTSNTATLSIPIVAPQPNGTYTISVACLNTNFTCTSVNLPLTVTSVNTMGTVSLTATVTPATAQPGSTATVTGTLTAATTGTTLTGTVTATITGVTGAVYVATLPGTAVTTGTYSIPVTVPTTIGSYSVSVTCNSTAFTCTTVKTTLTSSNSALIATATALTATASATTTGNTVLTATVTAASAGATALSGTVTFYDGTTPVGITLVTSSTTGTATAAVTITPSTATTPSYTAVYSGDTVYNTSSSPAISGTGVSSPASILLTTSTNAAIAGTNIILTAKVTGLTTAGLAPTGSVSFYVVGSGARLLGTVALTANGSGSAVAVLTSSSLPSGTLTIDAIYSGDSNFTTVTSNLVTIGLTDFSITFNAPTLTIIRGGSGVSTATVSFVGGLNEVVTLGCTPAADSAVTCSFSPAVLSSTGTSILTVQTVAPKTAALTPPAGTRSLKNELLGGVSFATLVCLLLPGRARRRLPTLLLMLVSLSLMATAGCGQNNFNSPLVSSGSPLGTTILTITTAGTDGTNTVRHTYYYQVTIE